MGSTITQCFASKQSIPVGAAVRIVPLIMGCAFRPTHCSHPGLSGQSVFAPNAKEGVARAWSPQEGFLEALASENGEHKLIETPHNVFVLTNLFSEMYRRCAVVDRGDRHTAEPAFNMRTLLEQHAPVFAERCSSSSRAPYTPIPWAEAESIWEAMQPAIRNERLFFANHGTVFRPMGFGVMLEVAYQRLLALGESTMLSPDCSAARQLYLPALVAAGFKLNREKFTGAYDTEVGMRRAHMDIDDVVWNGLHKFDKDAIESNANYSKFTEALRDYVNYADGGLDPEFFLAVGGYLDNRYVLRGLELCNLALEPTRYAAHDRQNESGQRYAQFVTEVASAVRSDIRAKFGD